MFTVEFDSPPSPPGTRNRPLAWANEETYTTVGLRWIDDADFKTVLLRHYPELRHTGLANVKNAFEPSDLDERLDPDRHPLRAFDKELEPDAWVGDLTR